MKQVLILFLSVLVASCGKPDAKNLEEKTQRELMVQNDNLDKRALQLETELSRKQFFFSALEGTFEGSFFAGEKEFKTRVTLIPSLPPYTANRIRTLEEVTADLGNLYFSIQTTHWNSKGTAVAAGCIFSQIRPDYDNGQVVAASGNCSNVYKISMYDSKEDEGSIESTKTGDILSKSQSISSKVLSKQMEKINEIHIVIQPTLVAKTFVTVLKRVQP